MNGKRENAGADVHPGDAFFRFLCDKNLFLCQKSGNHRLQAGKVRKRNACLPDGFVLLHGGGIGRRGHAGHGVSGVVRKADDPLDLDPLHAGGVQPLLHLLRVHGIFHGFVDLNIQVFPPALHPKAQGGGKAHDLMRAEARGIGNIDPRPADGLLEKPHHVQMADEPQRAVFGKLYPKLHVISVPPPQGGIFIYGRMASA